MIRKHHALCILLLAAALSKTCAAQSEAKPAKQDVPTVDGALGPCFACKLPSMEPTANQSMLRPSRSTSRTDSVDSTNSIWKGAQISGESEVYRTANSRPSASLRVRGFQR